MVDLPRLRFGTDGDFCFEITLVAAESCHLGIGDNLHLIVCLDFGDQFFDIRLHIRTLDGVTQIEGKSAQNRLFFDKNDVEPLLSEVQG